MDDRTRTPDESLRIPNERLRIQDESLPAEKVLPEVAARLQTQLEGLLNNEFGNGVIAVPLLVTRFPKQTGPLFKVTLQIDYPAEIRINPETPINPEIGDDPEIRNNK